MSNSGILYTTLTYYTTVYTTPLYLIHYTYIIPYTLYIHHCCTYCCRVETKIKEFKYIPETLAANKDLRKLYTNNNNNNNNNSNNTVYMCYTVCIYSIMYM